MNTSLNKSTKNTYHHMHHRGQILPISAILATFLFGIVALFLDLGYARYAQRVSQTVADSAALAYANEQAYGLMTDAERQQVVQGIAQQNYNNIPFSSVTSQMSTATANEVTANVGAASPIFFGGILGQNNSSFNVTTSARATATIGYNPQTHWWNNCVIQSTSKDVSIGSGNTIWTPPIGTFPGCYVISNAFINYKAAAIGDLNTAGLIFSRTSPTSDDSQPGQSAATTAEEIDVATINLGYPGPQFLKKPMPSFCWQIDDCRFVDTFPQPCSGAKASNITLTNANPTQALKAGCYTSIVVTNSTSGSNRGTLQLNPGLINVSGNVTINADYVVESSSVTGPGTGTTFFVEGNINMKARSIALMEAALKGIICGTLWSSTGSISLQAPNIALNGIVYAPNGTVTLRNADKIAISDIIGAQVDLLNNSESLLTHISGRTGFFWKN